VLSMIYNIIPEFGVLVIDNAAIYRTLVRWHHSVLLDG